MNIIQTGWWTAKGVGWDNLGRRLLQAWRVRIGLLRRRLEPSSFSQEAFAPQCRAGLADQPECWKRRQGRFLPAVAADALARMADESVWAQNVTRIAAKALAGDYPFFSRWFGRLGWPPEFNLDPLHHIRWPAGEHWLGTARSGPPRDDIKLAWEPSRFALAWHFARAHARSGEEKWAQAFWAMFDAWVAQNPPQLSVAWGCGQEMTFRLMAMLFAAVRTLDSPAATPERLYALTRLAWQTGKHIDININQARMTGNNHAISEAVGLWTVGLLFPELAQAGPWHDRGRRILAAEVARQIDDDGSYVQHSLNYLRVMLDDLLWACALARIHGQELPPVVPDRLERATSWLVEMIDPASGGAPNYGNNDGASVLPLSCCDYPDFRPTAQAAWFLLHGARCFPPGPWDEKMLWLFGPASLEAPVKPLARRAAFSAPGGGYYILRGGDSWAMVRCHSYRHRPAQADMLHLDLWYKGVNILRDGGSYLYYAPPPWGDYFHSTAAHNTIEVDGQSQMVKGPRFLWFYWTRSSLLRFETSPDGATGCFEGEHYGYARLPGRIVHRRKIVRKGDLCFVIDDLLGAGRHDFALRWRLCPTAWQESAGAYQADIAGEPFQIALRLPEGIESRLLSGQEGPPPEGWESLYYGQKTPAPTIVAAGAGILPARLITLIGPAEKVDPFKGAPTEQLLAAFA